MVEKAGMTRLARHIDACNRFRTADFLPFEVAGRVAGAVRRRDLGDLAGLEDILEIGPDRVRLPGCLDTPAKRTEALLTAARALVAAGRLRRLRDEPYIVTADDHLPEMTGRPALCELDRAAVPFFGTRGWGVHVNGFLRKGGEILMWVAERARHKTTYPGRLDNMVAGGQPASLGVAENLIKEAGEEASIPAALARQARPVGAISYNVDTRAGLRCDVIYAFDLELPRDFVPVPDDGEVAAFHLMTGTEALDIVRTTDRFKFNCNLVVIDFALRHGLIGRDHPEYEALRDGLRRPPAFREIARQRPATSH